jgi:hypothetical protein
MRARPAAAAGPGCGALARPNVLMFGDGDWDEARTAHSRLSLLSPPLTPLTQAVFRR